MDIHFVEVLSTDSVTYRRFSCLANAMVWYLETNLVGIGISGVEAVLYTTCIFLYTVDETIATALLARHFICLMLAFNCQSPILAICTAAYFIFYSKSFEHYIDTIVAKSAVVNTLSLIITFSKYLYMYMASVCIVCLYSNFFVKGIEDISLFAAVSVPLLHSCLEEVTNDTLFVVLALLLFWGEKKLNVFGPEAIVGQFAFAF